MTGAESEEPSNEELRRYLHEHIPLSRDMEVAVERADRDGVELSAPLTPNINHRETVFGGSLSALGILAGWTLVYVRLRSLSAGRRIVIQRNRLEYLAPVTDRFAASCETPPESAWEKLLKLFHRRGMGRIELDVTLTSRGNTVGNYQGTYVVQDNE